MNLQEQVAARRAELARSKQIEAAKATEAAKEQALAEQANRLVALQAVAAELSTPNIEIVAKGEQLKIVPPRLDLSDVEALKASEARKLLNREARKLWTTGENWLVISCISGGVCLLHIAGIGLVPLVVGLLKGSNLNKDYRRQVVEMYPELALVAVSKTATP